MSKHSHPSYAIVLGVALAALGPTIASGAGLLIADGGFGGQLEIQEHNVTVVINNGVAVTEVEQVFVNTEARVVEALYTFPVPKGASVANFSMWIEGREMIGEVVEKERARQIYDSYKRVRRDPGLLEQVDYKRFEMRIFPIAAGAEQRVKIAYYQELDFDHDWATYVYPLATVTQHNVDQHTSGKFAMTVDVKSEVPVVEMESPSHASDMIVVSHTPHYWQASLETHGGDLNRDLVIAHKIERPRTGVDVITSKPPGDDGYFMLTLTAGQELSELSEGMDYVFVLDISGSMAHDGKLRQSRSSLTAFIEALGQQDRFDVITFNVAANTLFDQLTEVDARSLDQARDFIEAQKARGGTALRPAITGAYRYQEPDRTLNVVILSDGMTQQDEQQELLQLIQQRPSGARVFCIGVGNEVNRPLLEQMAKDAGGLAAFVSQEDSFDRQAQAFRRKLMRPALTGVRVSFSGGGVYDLEPDRLPNLYHGAPIRLYGRYKKAGPVSVTIEGEVLGAPLSQELEFRLPNQDDTNPEIERMWAWHRVDRLMADQRQTGVDGQHRDEIVRLCEGYSIVSPYASFLVLENDGEYQRWKIKRRNAVRIQRDRTARRELGQELARLRERAAADLGPKPNGGSPLNEASLAPSATRPAASGPVEVAGRQPASPVSSNRSPHRHDITIPSTAGGGPGGGGAIDPFTGAIALGLGGASLAAARRRRRNGTDA